MKFFSKKLSNKHLWVFSIFALGLTAPIIAHAGFPSVPELIWDFFLAPQLFLLELETWLLPIIASYNDFTNQTGVVNGWIALRDLANMFFILLLLIISFATILNIQSYGYKQLLSRMIIIAILINFSRTIIGLAIDLSQVIMLTFVNSIKDLATGNIMVALGITKIMEAGSSQSFGNEKIALVLGGVMLSIVVVVMGVIIMMLSLRIIHLWIALVLSPLAFLAFIFPSAKKFYNQWAQELGKNLVSGPILVFFLWLTFTITGDGNIHNDIAKGQNIENVVDSPSAFLSLDNIINYVIAISLLLAGLQIASKYGGAGAQFASKGLGYIQKKAQNKYDRFPKALGIRAAGKVADHLIDEKGKPRGGRFGKILSKVPLYGGQWQRGAMKAQGWRSAMVDKFQAEDEKNINPKQREEYHRSQDSWRGRGPLGIGTAISKVTSLMGDEDQSFMASKTILERNEVDTKEKAETAMADFERMGYQPGIDAINKEWGLYHDETDATKDVNERNPKVIIDDLKTEAAELDEQGLAPEGIMTLLQALLEDKDTSGAVLGQAIRDQQSKTKRVNMSRALETHGERLMTEDFAAHSSVIGEGGIADESGIAMGKKNTETGKFEVEENENKVIKLNEQHPLIKQMEASQQTYPQQAVDIFNKLVGDLELAVQTGEYNFSDSSVGYLSKVSSETPEAFEQRVEVTKKDWAENNRAFEAGDIDVDTMYTTRRKLKGAYTNDEIDEERDLSKQKTADLDTRLANGDLSDEDYQREIEKVKLHQDFVEASPLKKISDDEDKEVELARRLSDIMPPPPVKHTAVAEDPTDEEVKARTKQIADGISKKEVRDRWIRTKGKGIEEVREQIIKEKTADVKKELIKEKTVVEQKKLDKQYDEAKSSYDAESLSKLDEIKQALQNVNNDAGATRLEAIGKEKKALEVQIKAEPNNINVQKALAKLMVEQNTLARTQNAKRKEALGIHTPASRNIFNRSVLKDATDGADFSRLQEMDLKNDATRELFKELTAVATQSQQREFLTNANPDQLEEFAIGLAKTGQKLNKVIMDNLMPNVKLRVAIQQNVLMRVEAGMDRAEAEAEVALLPRDKLLAWK